MSTSLTLSAEPLWDSPYVFSSFVALSEKGLPFDVKLVDLARGEQHDPGYARRSLTARVPSLEHDGFSLAESSAIAEYLEEAFPPPRFPALFPAGPRERARARQIMAWLRSDLGALREERPTTTMFFERARDPLGARAQADADKLVRVAGALLPAAGGALFGAWCLADAELAFMLHRLVLNGDPLPDDVRAWAAQQWQRPSVQAFVTRPRPASPR